MLAEEIRFDDNSRPSNSDQPVPPGGVLRALRNAAEQAGIDPISELYNESLRCATEGHLRMARERLQVLLGLAPDDGQARLLLAKVLVAGQRWQDALTALDEAQAAGEHIPPDLRRAVEDHLRADVAAKEEEAATLRAREQGEIKALRQEARRLRTEHAQILGRSHELEGETRKWAWATTAVAVIGLGFLGINLLIPSNELPTQRLATSLPTVASPTPTATPPAAIPSTPTEVAEAARTSLASIPELGEAKLAVTVKAAAATVKGEVVSAKQRRLAENALLGVPGITQVDLAGVDITARTKGTEHVVAKGDTLSKISLQYYGESTFAKRIQDSNTATLKGKTDLTIGQKLKLPPVK